MYRVVADTLSFLLHLHLMSSFTKRVSLFLFFCSFIIGAFFSAQQIQQYEAGQDYKNTLTFSNTQKWNPFFLASADAPFEISPEQFETITLPLPYTNTSDDTKKDLTTLHNYTQLRTSEKIAEIKSELQLSDAYFGAETFDELTNGKKRPNTSRLFDFIAEFEMPIIFYEKRKYNRVRPSYLDTTLSTVIEVPLHPSYPSGHATQSYLRALILSDLNPRDKNTYFLAAKRISTNREIAGLHYPSDSKAGELLAQQLYILLLQNKDFSLILSQAKTEW